MRKVSLLVLAVVLAPQSASAASESEIRALWHGAWVVLGVNTYSDCGGNYTDNEVRGALVASKGDYRFDPGEIAVVSKVNLERKKVEVLLDIAEPLLEPRREGPFTLLDEIRCKVEMEIPVASPRSAAASEVDRQIAAVLERYPDVDAARGSSAWNRRVRDPYPPDYEDTLAEYQAWRAEQINVAVAAKVAASLSEAARLVDRLRTDPDAMKGFVAGLKEARERYWSRDCDDLLDLSESSFVRRPPDTQSRAWRNGFEDAQRLVLYVEVGARLQGCFVPPP